MAGISTSTTKEGYFGLFARDPNDRSFVKVKLLCTVASEEQPFPIYKAEVSETYDAVKERVRLPEIPLTQDERAQVDPNKLVFDEVPLPENFCHLGVGLRSVSYDYHDTLKRPRELRMKLDPQKLIPFSEQRFQCGLPEEKRETKEVNYGNRKESKITHTYTALYNVAGFQDQAKILFRNQDPLQAAFGDETDDDEVSDSDDEVSAWDDKVSANHKTLLENGRILCINRIYDVAKATLANEPIAHVTVDWTGEKEPVIRAGWN